MSEEIKILKQLSAINVSQIRLEQLFVKTKSNSLAYPIICVAFIKGFLKRKLNGFRS